MTFSGSMGGNQLYYINVNMHSIFHTAYSHRALERKKKKCVHIPNVSDIAFFKDLPVKASASPFVIGIKTMCYDNIALAISHL